MIGQPSPLKFSLREIQAQAGLCLSLEVPAETLFPEPVADARTGGAPCRLSGPVGADIDFAVGGNRVLLQASLHGEWVVRCSRCLEKHSTGFSVRTEATFPLDEDSIDITEELRQTVLLELPQRSLCRPDCKGFCAQCGAALNERSCGCVPAKPQPFHALKKLKPDRGQ